MTEITLLRADGIICIGDYISIATRRARWQFWRSRIVPQTYVVTATRDYALTAVRLTLRQRVRMWLGWRP